MFGGRGGQRRGAACEWSLQGSINAFFFFWGGVVVFVGGLPPIFWLVGQGHGGRRGRQ